jgi:hypothetical protein
MSIAINELRIGNWVYPNDENATPYPVLGLLKDKWICCWENVIGDIEYVKYSDAQPITLTPEILKKCGFEKVKDGKMPYWKLVINRTEVISIEEDWSVGLNATDETSSQGYATNENRCKYLHQLQNLYFALTGQELTINLK